ncbi:hypothetical protein [Nonomuraea basaltis]|uniref:hypothetical protein n=1 Tax=Nonomuraea basaltis TaxID=2495887 RepID=UPI00110C47A7|nr:hypothetical protein [Nonomuraea basaltis]TMR88033.1 hypothetical protein EJK15_68475 [Nonomuraea basaltis]
MSTFDKFLKVVPSCHGYVIDRLSLAQVDDADALEIGLRWGPEKPDITLAFRDVYFFSIVKLPGPGAEPLDQVVATALEPRNESWPDGVWLDLVRSTSLPPLIWLGAEGPVQLNVIAAIATVSVEVL